MSIGGHSYTLLRSVNFRDRFFIEYISERTKAKFEVYSYEENKATYFGMKIEKVSNADSEGIIREPGNYADKINHIEIPHERTRQPCETLTEASHAISRSELCKLMWIARITRPGAIYDASAAAHSFSGGKNNRCFGSKRRHFGGWGGGDIYRKNVRK